MILIGDMNTNVSGCAHPCGKILEDLCHCFGLEQLVKQSTRISKTWESIIDLILVSDKTKISQSGTITYGISDHNIIFCTRKIGKKNFYSHKTVLSRSFKHYSQETFRMLVDEVDWSPVVNCSCVNIAWSQFKDTFLKIINKVTPLRQIRVKQRSSAWFDKVIHDAIKTREKALKNVHRTKNHDDFILYKQTRNKTQELIRDAKSTHYKNDISNNKDNPKKLWKTLKELGAAKTNTVKPRSTGLTIKGVLNFNKKEVANYFNIYFTSIAEQLVSNLQPPYGFFNIDRVHSTINLEHCQTHFPCRRLR